MKCCFDAPRNRFTVTERCYVATMPCLTRGVRGEHLWGEMLWTYPTEWDANETGTESRMSAACKGRQSGYRQHPAPSDAGSPTHTQFAAGGLRRAGACVCSGTDRACNGGVPFGAAIGKIGGKKDARTRGESRYPRKLPLAITGCEQPSVAGAGHKKALST